MSTAYFDPGGWLRTFWQVQWFAGVIPVFLVTPWLYTASKEGSWPKHKTLLWFAPIVLWAAFFIAVQALAMWAVHQRPPAIIVTAGGIWCAPWPDTTRWENIRSLGSYDKKAGYGWKTLGVTLNVTTTGPLHLQPPAYTSPALRWGIRLAQGPSFGHAPLELPCGTLSLNHDSQRLIRLIQEIHFKLGPRVDAKFRPRNRCWVDWCLKNRGLDHVCIANMPSDPSTQPCLAGVDY